MIWMLHLHTTLPKAIVAISCDGKLIHFLANEEQREHSAFLHVAIDQLLKIADIKPGDIQTVGVTSGPGSYSGIRVGLSAAKGFCYALKIPLITFNTLEALSVSFYQQFPEEQGAVCPMIDARRMEVFTAVYDKAQKLLLKPCALEIDEDSYSKIVGYGISAFVGSGSPKVWEMFPENIQLFNRQIGVLPQSLVLLTSQKYDLKNFEDVSNADALYLKPVYFAPKHS